METSLKYTPIVYKQTSYSQNQASDGTTFALEYKHIDLPEDGLLFFLPVYNCEENAKLRIKVPSRNATYQNVEFTYRDFNIQVENNNGTTRATTAGDILAYRLCIFRFKAGTNNIVLINSPLYLSAKYSEIYATRATFYDTPALIDKVNDTEVAYNIISSKELTPLEQRVKALEDRIIIGNQDPEEALMDAPIGTIYIKVED